jgi:MoaA/NifB/PqqE/SkfB family radical SAM enzyme
MLNIANIRLGLATNSSSSHSLIFLDNAKDDKVEDREFGWDFFTAASKSAKKDYLSLLLYYSLRHLTNNERISKIITSEMTGCNLNFEYSDDNYAYIEHQSIYHLPLNWEETDIDIDFFNDFKEYLLQDGLVILGGNDNVDPDNPDDIHPLDNGNTFKLSIPRDKGGSKGLVARKDGDWWILFNRKTGAKITMSFKNDAEPYVKASAPMLCDISGTERCSLSCPYCFANSSPSGQHSDTKKLYALSYILKELKVFEVSLGGAEITLHPDFIDILKHFRHNGIVPNFTTRSISWLKDNTMWPEIMKYCGSFAFSVNSGKDVDKIFVALKNNGIEPNDYSTGRQVVLQYAIGTGSIYDLENILRKSNQYGFRVTLLGYKEVGKGKDFKPQDNSDWLKVCLKLNKEYHLSSLSIDTKLAEKYSEQIKKSGIPEYMFNIKEGTHSCYIDAVNGKMAPSSYCDESEYKDLVFSEYGTCEQDAELVKEIFSKF